MNMITVALVGRLLRYLGSFHFVQEVDQDKYKSNNVTQALAIPGNQAGILVL